VPTIGSASAEATAGAMHAAATEAATTATVRRRRGVRMERSSFDRRPTT
jgi:hypothetical protein